jgi:quercetin dioxygenase-like cupin family protein
MTDLSFNNEAITWNRLEGIDHLQYFILDVDSERQIVDVLFKFDANEQIVLHRHVALNHMLVLQGEHRLYEPDGSVKEVRPAGRYTVSPASNDPHREGGGDEEVIILFSIRGTDGKLYEFLDDDMNVVGEFTMDDFIATYAAQQAA